ncbi:FAD dependent oxidoreductase [Phaeosphaeria sp. MPI-PUGE-AT-0046c]|nr:FAD dependent oxidoreductase [Phaeosphaeria sp. MPI-PUGE-AT-0046c]
MSASQFPHPNGQKSFWRTETGHLDRHRTTPELPEVADVVVIGGGFSAAAFVEHLLDGYDQDQSSILILEARQLCSGATGRNGGHLKPDNYHATARLAKKYGREAAEELALFEMDNIKAVEQYIARESVDCDFISTRAFDVQLTNDVCHNVESGYRALEATGSLAAQKIFAIPKDFAEKVSGVKGAKSAYSYSAGHCWPYRLVHHMFSKAIKKGVNLQTETRVNAISETLDQDGYWLVHTDRGTIRAKKFVVATNAYTAAILPEYQDKIVPYKGICCRIACPSDQSPLLTNSYGLRFSDWNFDYLVPRPDGSIIVGGARGRYYHNLDSWYANSDDSTLIEEAKSYFDGYMQRHFYGWENSQARVTHIWTGIMGYSSDRLPRVGAVPNRPGIFIMAGFTGHGMPQIFLTARGLANLVYHQKPFNASGIPRLFEETEERLNRKENDVLDMWRSSQSRSSL